MKFRRFVLRLSVGSFAVLSIGCAAYAPVPKGEKVVRNIEFAEPYGHSLRLDLYIPQSEKPVPVVLWIFGGSWKFGSRGFHVNLRKLTRYGIAIAAIDYRLSGTAKYPAQLQDCEAAIAWLKTNAHKYGIDPTQIGATGESAGGHLAALLGMLEGKSNIRAVCALYPPTNLVTLGRKYANPDRLSDIERLLGGPIETKLALAREASPTEHVSAGSPPVLMIHGANDQLVPPEQSLELDRKLQNAGVQSQVQLVPDQGHWFQLTDAQVAEAAEFLNTHFR